MFCWIQVVKYSVTSFTNIPHVKWEISLYKKSVTQSKYNVIYFVAYLKFLGQQAAAGQGCLVDNAFQFKALGLFWPLI